MFFSVGLPLGMTLIGFGDVITAVCLPRQKSQRIDKDFDQNRNAKMLAKMLANLLVDIRQRNIRHWDQNSFASVNWP